MKLRHIKARAIANQRRTWVCRYAKRRLAEFMGGVWERAFARGLSG